MIRKILVSFSILTAVTLTGVVHAGFGFGSKSPFLGTWTCLNELDTHPQQYFEGFVGISVMKIKANGTAQLNWRTFVDLSGALEDVATAGTQEKTWEEGDAPSHIIFPPFTDDSFPGQTSTTETQCVGQMRNYSYGYMDMKCIHRQHVDYDPESDVQFDHWLSFASECKRECQECGW